MLRRFLPSTQSRKHGPDSNTPLLPGRAADGMLKVPKIRKGHCHVGWREDGPLFGGKTERGKDDTAAAGRAAARFLSSGLQMGERSFPKLKIPHQSHADFCSTDTAGGLDNKKRRYAPRGGVAYRLFLWGFPKGATPPFGTRLCEAKCSVLYALSALP